ncbi:hypothetical protein M9458_053481, partial [Cirrhinus mrigala]
MVPELEKGLAKLQVMIDGRMCEICDSVDKVHSDLQETRLKLSELELRQDGFEGAIINMHEDIAEGKKHA